MPIFSVTLKSSRKEYITNVLYSWSVHLTYYTKTSANVSTNVNGGKKKRKK